MISCFYLPTVDYILNTMHARRTATVVGYQSATLPEQMPWTTENTDITRKNSEFLGMSLFISDLETVITTNLFVNNAGALK